MKVFRPILVGLISLVLVGCVSKKEPIINPELPSVVGSYEFSMVSVGAGHGHLFLPSILPPIHDQSQEWTYVEPSGSFIFNNDSTFKISFKMMGQALDDSGRFFGSERVEVGVPFDEVVGTYNITSNSTITFQTQYGTSEYFFSLFEEK